MKEKYSQKFKLLEKTGLKETTLIGNSRRAISANTRGAKRVVSQPKVGGCRGCSRKKRSNG
jgi:hypothetical protein